MAELPRVTVVIPTRERCDVLASALRTVTAQKYDNLCIIVSDNCSGDETKEVVRRADDGRITYLHTGKRLSMSQNWEFALSHVGDGWVTFMGDDDGLMPGAIMRMASLAQVTQALAIRSRIATYEWPGVSASANGQLIVPLASGVERRCTRQWLGRVLKGHVGYPELPMLYNGGFIHMSVLNEIKEKTGAFFLSVNPDIYSAIAISRTADHYIYSHEPFAISGTSRHSTGNSFFSKSQQRNEMPKTVFSSEGNRPFHPDMPLCADGSYPLSLHAYVYESYLQSAALGGELGMVVDHVQQLEIIMATAGKHRAAVEEWGKRFADRHRIDFKEAISGAAARRLYLQPRAWLRKAMNATGSVISEDLPISNIFEASIAAGVVRAAPGRADTWRFLVGRVAALLKLR